MKAREKDPQPKLYGDFESLDQYVSYWKGRIILAIGEGEDIRRPLGGMALDLLSKANKLGRWMERNGK